MLSIRFQQCFGPFILLLLKGSSETGLFRDLSNHVFLSREVQKDISYEGHRFFENVQNLIYISKMETINLENVFFFPR